MKDARNMSALAGSAATAVVFALVACAAGTCYCGWFDDWRMTNDPGMSRVCCNNGRSVACDPQGNVHVVWHDDCSGDFVIYYRCHDGTRWGEAVQLTSLGVDAQHPSMALDDSGNVYVVWHQFREIMWDDVYFMKYDGSTWGNLKKVSTGDDVSRYASVAVDNSGRICVVWQERLWFLGGEYREIRYRIHDGVSWGYVGGVTPISCEADPRYPSIVVDQDNNFHAVWYDDVLGQWHIFHEQYDSLGWRGEEVLTEVNSVSYRPTVAVDGSGHLHVVWYDNRDGNREIYRKVHDGTSWGDAERLTDDPGKSRDPSIAIDHTGNVHVAWEENRDGNFEIYYKRFDGIGWSADLRLTTAPDTSENPSIAVDPAGDVHVVWADLRHGNYEVFWKQWHGAALAKPEITAISPDTWYSGERIETADLTGNGFFPPDSVWLQLSGEPRVVAQGVRVESDDRISCAVDLGGAAPGWWDVVVRNPDGQTDTLHSGFYVIPERPWTAEQRLTTSGHARSVAGNNARYLACDHLDRLHLVWVDDRGGEQAIYYKLHDGETWGEDTRIGSDEYSPDGPSLAVDVNGHLHVVWDDQHLDSLGGIHFPDVYYKMYDGTSWSPETNVSEYDTTYSHYSSVAVDDSCHVHIAWQDKRDHNDEIYYRMFDGTTWGEITRLTSDEAPSLHPCIVTDGGGKLYVFWYDGRNDYYEIYYKVYDETGWGDDLRLTTSASASYAPSAAADASGNIHLVWYDNRDGNKEIYYKRFDGISWSEDQRATYDPRGSWNPFIAVHQDSTIHVVWEENCDENIEIYHIWSDGTNWHESRRLTTAPERSDLPKIALDSYGDVHVVWRDQRDGGYDLYYRKWDVEHTAGLVDVDGPESPVMITRIAPNPVRGRARIRFDLVAGQNAVLSIYDIAGRLVRRSALGGQRSVGHEVFWDRTDRFGQRVSSGVYFVTIEAGAERASAKIVVLN
jgi:hypothetical protein